jgi:tryptophan synthase beta chain
MYTLGSDYIPSAIHAGGLRYHGMSPLVSAAYDKNLITARSYDQTQTFEAGLMFARTEGIIPAPESCHAIAATVREALKCKETGNQKTILFNLSGHGFVDMAAYDQYISGELQDFHISDAELAKYMASADALNK